MRKLLVGILAGVLLLAVGFSPAQDTSRTAVRVIQGATVPATCNIGDVFYQTGGTAGLYLCTAANSFTLVSGPASGVTSVSNADGTLTISPTTGAVVSSIALGHTNTWTVAQNFTSEALSAKITTYNNILTAGNGVPAVVGLTSQKNETTTADPNVLTVTPPAAAGTYRVSVMISVSAATTGVISWTLSWTDSNGTAQSNIAQNLVQIQPAGTPAAAQSFTTSAAGNYAGSTVIDINAGAASIIVKWVGGGTTTAKMSAAIEQLN